jgi:hypothetical protein
MPFHIGGQNGGTSFHHQSQCSVGCHHPREYFTETIVMTDPYVPFCACLSTIKGPNDNGLSGILSLLHSTVSNAKPWHDFLNHFLSVFCDEPINYMFVAFCDAGSWSTTVK